MKKNKASVMINGIEYVPATDIKVVNVEGMEYKIVRTDSAGVFAGYVESRKGKEAVLRNVRRLWYWEGAATLSQLATDGVSKPDLCKFPCEVNKIELTGVIEVLDCTAKAKQSIDSVSIWSA